MPQVCLSFDVERDYRKDGKLSIRGIEEGLPVFSDTLRSQGIPFDIVLSGEVVEQVPTDLLKESPTLVTIGCHGLAHSPGYLCRMSDEAQSRDLTEATRRVRAAAGHAPQYFRAPNFSADGRTIRILQSLGYRVDSSVLPGRHVRKWRIRTLVDHRGAPTRPYGATPDSFPRGSPATEFIEVPVTANPVLPGGPLGLGFLHARGVNEFLRAVRLIEGEYIVILGHSWEMVKWTTSDPVAPWVRDAGRNSVESLNSLVSSLDGMQFTNLPRIADRVRGLRPPA